MFECNCSSDASNASIVETENVELKREGLKNVVFSLIRIEI